MIDTAAISFRRKRWVVARALEEEVGRLAHEMRLPRMVAELLVNRGLADAGLAAAFLEPRFKDVYSPWLIPNMEAGAERIARAVREREKITLYGDYDVDGITGTAMLWHTLKAAGAEVEYYIPHRVEEGYGVNVEAVKEIIAGGTKLIVTVDCGCSGAGAVAAVVAAREGGVDVVVSDHHEMGDVVPAAVAIVHPRAKWAVDSGQASEREESYPNGDLCGAGVAYKLAWAVAEKLSGSPRVNEVYRELLVEFPALGALGTIADVVPLVGENRILVKYGLGQLTRTRFEGLRALIHAAGYGEGGKKMDCMAVGFTLAPRLNAAGRMGHAREAVELLTTATGARAAEIATYLEKQNRERQSTEKKMVAVAREQIEVRNGQTACADQVMVVVDRSFHAGVVGIVASRLVDTYYRPAFVLAQKDTELHGSARSVAGFELHLAIEHVRDLLISGGGHAMAGGVRLAEMNLEAFRVRLNKFASGCLTEELLMPSLKVDGELTLTECTPRVISALEKMAPFGRGNPQPRFEVRGVRLTAPPRRVGATGAHLQLTVGHSSRVVRCIAFGMGELGPQMQVGMELNLIVEPKMDEYNGVERVEMMVVDVARGDGEQWTVGSV